MHPETDPINAQEPAPKDSANPAAAESPNPDLAVSSNSGLHAPSTDHDSDDAALPVDEPGFPLSILEDPRPRVIHKRRPGDDPNRVYDTRPTRPDRTPLAPPAIRDTYDLPNLYTTQQYIDLVEQHHADNDADFAGRPRVSPGIQTVFDLITPDIGTPEYNARPERLRKAFRKSLRDLPQIAALNTLEDFEEQAVLLCRYIQAYPELIQLIGDVRLFCCVNEPDYFDTYQQPHARAGNFITPDLCEEDPAPINLYLQRARKKTAISMNRMLDRELEGRELDPDRVKNLLAFAAMGKYIKQSNPNTPNGPGRPLDPHGKTMTRSHQMPSNHGGRRIGAGGKFKRRKQDDDSFQEDAG
jgi:hypothetical protein